MSMPTQDGGFALSRKRDRKSTRLNSSHQIISYAVFCLKKKKTTRAIWATSHRAKATPPLFSCADTSELTHLSSSFYLGTGASQVRSLQRPAPSTDRARL